MVSNLATGQLNCRRLPEGGNWCFLFGITYELWDEFFALILTTELLFICDERFEGKVDIIWFVVM